MDRKKKNLELVEAIIEAMQNKKGHDITHLDLREIGNSSADHFIICHGDSSTQVQAISDAITDHVKKELGENPLSSEGKTNAEWVLIDYFNVVAHVFYKETRTFFDLESLWGDARIKQIEYQI